MKPCRFGFPRGIAVVALLTLTMQTVKSQPPRLDSPANNGLPTTPASRPVSQTDLDTIRDQIAGVDDKQKESVSASLQRAEGNRASILAAETELANVADLIRSIPTQLDDLKSTTRIRTNPMDLSDKTIEELQTLVSQQTATVGELKKLADDATAAVSDRIGRRQKLQERILGADSAIASVNEKLSVIDSSDGVATQAVQLELRSQIQRIRKDAELAQARLTLMDSEDQIELPRLRAEHFKTLLAVEQKTLADAQALLNTRRGAEAATTKKRTEESDLGDNPLLRSSFEENLKIASDNKLITDAITTTDANLKAQNELYSRIAEDYRDANNRVKTLGLTDSIGAMLRNQQQQLPNELTIRFAAKDYEQKLNNLQFQLYDLQQQKHDLSSGTIVSEIRRSNAADDVTIDRLAQPIELLVQQRSELISQSLENHQKNFDQLVELENREKRLAVLTRQFRDFINTRILWIRSNDGLWSSLAVDESDMQVVRPDNWLSVFRGLSKDASKNVLLYLFAIVVACAATVFKPRFRTQVDELGVVAARGSCQTIRPTLISLILSSAIALSKPLMLLFIGWRIRTAGAQAVEYVQFGSALGQAIMIAASFAIPIEILRRYCRRSGLASQHFAWSDDATEKIRKALRWFSPMTAVAVFGIALLSRLEARHQNDLVERLLFIVAMVLLERIIHACFHPKVGIFRSFLIKNENAWASQLSTLWYAALVAIPFSLGLLTFVGYYYTAFNLAFYVFLTFVFGLVVETLRALLLRLILVRRRRAHVEVARRRRIAQNQQSAANNDDEEGELAAVVKQAIVTDADLLESFDVNSFAQQSRKLISLVMIMVWIVGVWMIWTDVLPALKRLDGYPIWPPGAAANEIASGSAESESHVNANASDTDITSAIYPAIGSSEPTNIQGTVITIHDAFKFLFIAALTFLLAKNLPGLMEMTFLKQLPVEASIRYAIKTIVTYLVVLFGVMLAFWSVNIGWAQVQWLAAALTFGLAFGLQEIFANFVAGIILLFERPIRIGDVVTIDNITGVVTKIRIRATTICNWDRKEYVIPNKEFITGRVLNWTLSDQVNRIVIEVGVAYGSDLQRAKDLLYDICQNHSGTISDPPTRVTFEKFGDSSLLLVVRTFVPDVDRRLSVIDQLHTQINDAFNEAGIEIAFPQLDVHVSGSESPVTK